MTHILGLLDLFYFNLFIYCLEFYCEFIALAIDLDLFKSIVSTWKTHILTRMQNICAIQVVCVTH